jgi:2-phosphoglycerate kinase
VAPFSVGLLSRYLEGCAVEREDALKSARTVQDILRLRKVPEINSNALRCVVYQTLKRDQSELVANRYLSRCHFEDSRQPLIILIGGPSGSGKSTVTSGLAYLLDISHTQSTDMMREIIRCYLASHVVPTLSYSSFEAWRGLPEVDLQSKRRVTDNPVIAGFLSQAGTVRVALEATIARALKEHQDIIVDGVHVLPSQMDLDEVREKAVLVPIVLAVTTVKRLGRQLRRRSREQPNRDSSRQQEDLDAIWDIQTYMLDQAERSNTPVIVNWNPDETVRLILEEVMNRISERFPATPSLLDEKDAG